MGRTIYQQIDFLTKLKVDVILKDFEENYVDVLTSKGLAASNFVQLVNEPTHIGGI